MTLDITSMKSLHVLPAKSPISGHITIPGSKSYSNRAILAAAMASGKSSLKDVLSSDDTEAMYSALMTLGIQIDRDSNRWDIQGCGADWPLKHAQLQLGSAGTVARFLTAVLGMSGTGHWVLDASDQMRQRPIDSLLKILEECGCECDFHGQPYSFPFSLKAAHVKRKSVTISGKQSSQFISALLMAAPLVEEEFEMHISDHIVQQDYVKMTIHLLNQFGITIETNDAMNHFKIFRQPYHSVDLSVEADASTATYFMALAAITKGRIEITNLSTATLQPDIEFIDILKSMGCIISVSSESIEIQGPDQLKGGFRYNMRPLSDASLTLAALAPFADQPIEFYGVEHIRHHESDRLSVMAQLFQKLGIQHIENTDGLVIHPGVPQLQTVDTFDDHRVAMSLALLGIGGNGMILRDPACVRKTCPNFFDLLMQLGIQFNLSS